MCLFAELIANDKPILIKYDGEFYVPVVVDYPETLFGGFLETTAEYADPEVREMIEEKGWIIWPLIHFSYDTVNYELAIPAPAIGEDRKAHGKIIDLSEIAGALGKSKDD